MFTKSFFAIKWIVLFFSLSLIISCGGGTSTTSSSDNPVPVVPSITTQPQSQAVTAGRTATFSVAAAGTAPLSYQWQKNGGDISGAGSASYTTPATTTTDSGSAFTVTVTNGAGSVTSNVATLTVNAESPSINLISNPGFESGTTSWTFYTSGAGAFTAASPGSEGTTAANLALSSGGTNVQLYQIGVTLEPNTLYRLSFSGYSTTGHDVTVNLQKHGSPYTSYGLSYTADLGTNWQTFTTEFTTSGFTSAVSDGRLMFWLAPFAAAGDTYYIDDVKLEKVSAQDTVSAPTFSPSPAFTYTTSQSVSLSVSPADAVIHYTLDGTDPLETSPTYAPSTPITVSSTTTIKAKAWKPGLTPSSIAGATYSIGIPVLTSVTVSPYTASIGINATQTFTAIPKDQNNNTMTGITIDWTSSDTAVATVNSSGIVIGITAGTATITASSGGVSGTASLTVTEASTACTVTVGDIGSGSDYEVDHSADEVQINNALTAVGACASALQRGTVILKETTVPYMIDNKIWMYSPYVTLRGESTTPKADGNQRVTIKQSGVYPAYAGTWAGVINIRSNYIQIRNLHLDGNLTANRSRGGGWTHGSGSTEWISSPETVPNVHDIVIEDLSAFDTTDDVVRMAAKNLTIRNIYSVHIGHSTISLFSSTESDANHLVENIYCRDLVNACVRYTYGVGNIVIRNIYAIDPQTTNGAPGQPGYNTNGNAGYYTQMALELWVGNTCSYKIKGVYAENLTAIHPASNGIVLEVDNFKNDNCDMNAAWHIEDVIIKNLVVDCLDSGGAGACGGEGNDVHASIGIRSANNVTLDGVMVYGSRNFYGTQPALGVWNYNVQQSTITVKNSIFINAVGYGIYGNGNINWNVHYNLFNSNALGNAGGLTLDATNKVNEDPRFVRTTEDYSMCTSYNCQNFIPMDLHLQSTVGHWNGTGWTNDSLDSPALSAGDPTSDNSKSPSGGIIEMGAYGNTPEASKVR